MTTPITRDLEDEDIEKTALNQPATNLAMLYGLKLLRQEMGAMKRELIEHKDDDRQIQREIKENIAQLQTAQGSVTSQVTSDIAYRKGKEGGKAQIWAMIMSAGAFLGFAIDAAINWWKK